MHCPNTVRQGTVKLGSDSIGRGCTAVITALQRIPETRKGVSCPSDETPAFTQKSVSSQNDETRNDTVKEISHLKSQNGSIS